MGASTRGRIGLQAGGFRRPGGDPACLIWLRHREHVCRAEDDRVDPGGARCAIWARVQAARRYQAVDAGDRNRYQLKAEHAAVGLVPATRDLLEAADRWTGIDPHLADVASAAATALLQVDQLAALAGWRPSTAEPGVRGGG